MIVFTTKTNSEIFITGDGFYDVTYNCRNKELYLNKGNGDLRVFLFKLDRPHINDVIFVFNSTVRSINSSFYDSILDVYDLFMLKWEMRNTSRVIRNDSF